jgi:TetR/AcrR family transcriptional repressor of bet genes
MFGQFPTAMHFSRGRLVGHSDFPLGSPGELREGNDYKHYRWSGFVSTLQKTAAAEPAPERASRTRQRQKLIDACISALYAYGPSRTTIEKVVTIAHMSPGIVSFYFDSKAAMLMAALEYLAGEFEEQVLVPVTKLKGDPAQALEALVDLYLDAEIASPRKVSVWYAFWGEASSRKEYYDICGQKDAGFENLVQELIGRLIVESRALHLDPDGVSLGLLGALEMTWQDIAFQVEENIDRDFAKRRCLNYLRSVFPQRFGARTVPVAQPGLPSQAYCDPARFDLEKPLFRRSVQFVGHAGEMTRPGDYRTLDLPGERILAIRAADGDIRFLRNLCGHRPHAVAIDPAGHFAGAIICPVDGTAYDIDGPGLVRLDGASVGGLVLAGQGAEALGELVAGVDLAGLVPSSPLTETDVAADWKILVQHWLDRFLSGADRRLDGLVDQSRGALVIDAAGLAWTAPRVDGTGDWRRVLIWPGLLIERRPDGASLLQVLAAAAGRSRVRVLHLSPEGRQGETRQQRDVFDTWLVEDLATARSTQEGLDLPGAAPLGDADPTAKAFHDWLDRALQAGESP